MRFHGCRKKLIQMNRIKFFVVLAPLFIAACAAKTAAIDMDLETLLQDVEKKAYVIRGFRVEFVKTRISGAFSHKISVNGSLVFQKPGRFCLSLAGDVNVEVLSNGEHITLIHDRKDRETFRLGGDRDLSRFADPLMVLISSIGDGGLRRFPVVGHVRQDDEIIMEVAPGNENHFQRTERVFLCFSVLGELRKIRILFKDGNVDETVFDSWSVLAENDPEILDLDARLKSISEISDAGT